MAGSATKRKPTRVRAVTPDLGHIAEPLRPLAVPLASLTPDPANARTHSQKNIDAIRGSLAAFGQVKPVVVRKQTMTVVCGNGTLAAAVALGWTHLAAVVKSMDQATATALAIADNRASELAEWDTGVLDTLLADLATGDEQLDAMLAELATESNLAFGLPEAGGGGDEFDATPEESGPTRCQPGDLWIIGGVHRLLCGDSTKAEDVARVMGGKRAALCLTDPPYGVGWDYNGTDDTVENLERLIAGFLPLARDVSDVVLLTPGNSRCQKYPSWDWCLCWFVAAGTGMNPWGFTCWQPVLAYGKCPYLARGLGSRPDGLAKTESAPNLNHPCPKPIGVWQWFIERGSVEDGDIVFDPFLGSGTTLIAAHRLGRKCYGLEIEPRYCDVILKRAEAEGLTVDKP